MPIDPDAENLLAIVKAVGRPTITSLSPPEARAANLASRALLQTDLPNVGEVREVVAPGPHGPIPLRLYRGLHTSDDLTPTLVFSHGGGWVIGNCDSHDYVCRKLANEVRCAVVSIEYRLAPEYTFPTAIDDSLAATQWIAQQADKLGLDAARFAIGGDSAGGNISAVLALMARDGAAPTFVHQLLLYPAVDMNMDTPSFTSVPDHYPVSPAVSRWFREHYLNDTGDRMDWRASPLYASSHAGVASAFVLTARHDPFCDEGRQYARKLENAGVRVWHLDMNDQLHGFLTWGKLVRAADTALEMAAASLRYAFAIARA